MLNNLRPYRLLLASKSPRRQFLLKELGIDFTVQTKEVDESFPGNLKGKHIALYLCKKKAGAFLDGLQPNDLLITADTIVCIKNKVLNKPAGRKEAIRMLKILSGKVHTVYTGVCLASLQPSPLLKEKVRGSNAMVHAFISETKVHFNKLSDQVIGHYIDHYKPFDKAGSYGAQECLPEGMNPCSKAERGFLERIGKPDLYLRGEFRKPGAGQTGIVNKISGSYFNVMGLPVRELYEKLMKV